MVYGGWRVLFATRKCGIYDASMSESQQVNKLAPWPVRLIVYGLLVLIGIASVWLIDHRAMQKMHQINARIQAHSHHQTAHSPTEAHE